LLKGSHRVLQISQLSFQSLYFLRHFRENWIVGFDPRSLLHLLHFRAQLL
jgi:hypothetical protein